MNDQDGVRFRIDLDRGSAGVGATVAMSQIRDFLDRLSTDAHSALGLLPSDGKAAAGIVVDLNTGLTAADLSVGASAVPAMTAVLLLEPGSGIDRAAVAVTLDTPLDLGATPLFGQLLSGISISGLTVSYAAAPVSAHELQLPDGRFAPDSDLGAGLELALALVANGAQEVLELTSPDAGQTVRSAITAEAFAPASAAASSTPDVLWFTVGKAFGPLTVCRIGVARADDSVGLALDASLTTDIVSVMLTGFVLRVSRAGSGTPTVQVDLDGLAVNLSASNVQIAGSLDRTPVTGGVEYDGSLVMRLGQYAINAAGSYAVVNGTPSLFVFALAQGDFGGPPMFFVTGLAAGFGVNRGLRLPSPQQVRSFPLIQAATQGAGYLPSSGTAGTQQALALLASGGWVPPTRGEYWVAAGVAFRSFQLINGFALLSVQFGNDLIIALTGIAALRLPSGADGGPTFAYVEVTLEAELVPSAGTFELEVLLSPNSYLISPDCHLSGGLAVSVWFGPNPHAGDFVITLGGYHPLFVKPAWYPTVPRLGFGWKLTDAVQLSGESYFALTPSCVMGGGRLALTFTAGGLRAWFTAQADFIMYWRPFWFDIDVMIAIGISYSVSLAFFTASFSVTLGVALELWGPPLRGLAHVNWFVISFDIPINGGGTPPGNATTLADWHTFATTSLPSASDTAPAAALTPGSAAASAAPICKARAASGLQGMADLGGGHELWLVDGDGVSISTESAVPASSVLIGGAGASGTLALAGEPVNVYPLAGVSVTAVHTVLLAEWTGVGWQPGQALPAGVDVSEWNWSTVQASVPAALWGPRGHDGHPALGSSVVEAVVGVRGSAPATTTSGGMTVSVTALETDRLSIRSLPLPATTIGTAGPVASGDTRSTVAASISAPAVAKARVGIIAAAEACGLMTGLVSDSMTLFGTEINSALAAAPMLGVLGTTGPPATAFRSPVTAALASVPPLGRRVVASIEPEPRAVGCLRAIVHHDLASTRREDGAVPRGRTPMPAVHHFDRWAARHDRHLAARRTAAVDADSQAGVRLAPGSVAVFDLGDATAAVRTDPSGPVWLVALDNAQHVLEWRPLAAGETEPVLPATTHRLALHRPAGSSGILGWRAASRLTQISSQTLLADGVLVRAQSPSAVGGRRSRRSVGVRTAGDLVACNLTMTASGQVEHGWIETWLPASCTEVLVAIVRDDDATTAAGTAVPEPAVSLRGATSASLSPGLAERRPTADGAEALMWRYGVVPADDGSPCIIVRTCAPCGWHLDGVAAENLAPSAESVEADRPTEETYP